MLQGILVKKVLDLVLKQIFKKFDLNKINKYVEEDNELDLQIRAHAKSLDKYGRYIEEIEKDVAILKKHSHSQADFVCMKCGCHAKRVEKVTKKRRK